MVEFNVKFGQRVNDKLAESQIRKSKNALKKLSCFFIAFSLIFIIIPLISGLKEEDDIFIFSLGIFLLVFWAIFPSALSKTIKKQQNKNGTMTIMTEATEEVYKFDEEKVFIFTNLGEKYRSAVETVYSYFTNVVEDDDSYMLFVSKVQCHVVFKDCLTKGTLEEFESILHSHFSEKNYTKIHSEKDSKATKKQ